MAEDQDLSSHPKNDDDGGRGVKLVGQEHVVDPDEDTHDKEVNNACSDDVKPFQPLSFPLESSHCSEGQSRNSYVYRKSEQATEDGSLSNSSHSERVCGNRPHIPSNFKREGTTGNCYTVTASGPPKLQGASENNEAVIIMDVAD